MSLRNSGVPTANSPTQFFLKNIAPAFAEGRAK